MNTKQRLLKKDNERRQERQAQAIEDNVTYVATWKAHIQDLERLKWNLDMADQDELDAQMEKLTKLMYVAAKNQIKRRS